jgi:hypothetical protein
MIDPIYNPYAFPRIKRKAARGIIGSGGPGAPGANRTQLQGSRQPIQRGPGRPVPRGINKTSVTDQEQGGAVSGFQSGAQSGKGVIDAYEGGQKIRAGLGKMSDSISNSDTWANLTGGGQGMENISSQLGFGGNQAALSGTSGLSGGGDFNSLGQMDMSGLGSSGSFGGGEASGLLSGSEGATAGEGLSGLDGMTTGGGEAGGAGPTLAYAKIGLDVIDGGPQGQKITGNTYGDAALRAGAAYFTAGLSEIGYMFL